MATKIKLTKVAVGWWATHDGTWAVIGDNPADVPTKTEVEESESRGGILTGMNTQREWQIVHDTQGRLRESNDAGDTIAWVDTLTEGRARLAELI